MDLKANYRVINIKDITSFPGSFQVKAIGKISVFIKEVCPLKNKKNNNKNNHGVSLKNIQFGH